MKHIKLFNESLSELWEAIQYNEYNRILDSGTIKFNNREISLLLDFINIDSSNRSLEIEVDFMRRNIIFNIDEYLKLGSGDNIREPLLVRITSNTKSGGILIKYFFIRKCKDDWFIVQLVPGLLYKCDQIDGLLKLLNDIG
jgi:hypothetical protein